MRGGGHDERGKTGREKRKTSPTEEKIIRRGYLEGRLLAN